MCIRDSISAPEGSLKTYQQQIAYVRQRITDDKARNMSAKTLKQASNINEVGNGQPTAVDQQGDVEQGDANLIYALRLQAQGYTEDQVIMYMKGYTEDQVIMYTKGKGKGKYNPWKGKGGKGKDGKGKGKDGKGGKGGKDGKGKGYPGKGKGKGIKGACWTCNEIGHRAEDCPKKKPISTPSGKLSLIHI